MKQSHLFEALLSYRPSKQLCWGISPRPICRQYPLWPLGAEVYDYRILVERIRYCRSCRRTSSYVSTLYYSIEAGLYLYFDTHCYFSYLKGQNPEEQQSGCRSDSLDLMGGRKSSYLGCTVSLGSNMIGRSGPYYLHGDSGLLSKICTLPEASSKSRRRLWSKCCEAASS